MKLLIVEDNIRLAERIRLKLHKHFAMDVVGSGSEALERTQSVEYDIIVLDLGLPDMSGLEVCRQLRALDITAPLLVLTGVDDGPTRVALLDELVSQKKGVANFSNLQKVQRKMALALVYSSPSKLLKHISKVDFFLIHEKIGQNSLSRFPITCEGEQIASTVHGQSTLLQAFHSPKIVQTDIAQSSV